MDNQTYKLDIYDKLTYSRISNCQKGEKYCAQMIPKLVFYDRNQILDMHAASLTKDGVEYDISKLKPNKFLDMSEKVTRILPLESKWIAVLFENKQTGEPILDKVMYISPNGDGYFSSDVQTAVKSGIPEEIYVRFIRDDPNGLWMIDKKYFDGTHLEFEKKLNDAAREVVTKIFADLLDNPEIKLEDLYPMIVEGLRHREDEEKLSQIRFIDFAYAQFRIEEIINFDKNYEKRKEATQFGEGE